MFGKNPIRSATSDPTKLAVEGHFYTLQGEGPYSGKPALFIRLAGCNLACWFCDTQFETQADKLTPTEDLLHEILNRYPEKQREFVVITGGEPFLQDFSWLAEGLLSNGTKLIQIETAGTLWQPSLSSRITVGDIVLVCSPKTPKVHPMIEAYCRHWKYVIRAGMVATEDGLPVTGTNIETKMKILPAHRPYMGQPSPWDTLPRNIIYVSPCDEYDSIKNYQNMMAAKNSALQFGHTLSLQVHKIVNVE